MIVIRHQYVGYAFEVMVYLFSIRRARRVVIVLKAYCYLSSSPRFLSCWIFGRS